MTFARQLIDDRGRHGGRNRKSDSHIAAIWRKDSGIYADDITASIEQGAARIAAVDRRIDLKKIVKGTRIDITPAG